MKQLKELARLRFGLGRSHSEIAASLQIARPTVQEALRRFRTAGLSWPLAAELDDNARYVLLYPVKENPAACPVSDFAAGC
jgi:DNA-binding MarR family transcriptional regulator